MNTKREIIVFVAIAFALAMILSFLTSLTGISVGVLPMFIPAIAVGVMAIAFHSIVEKINFKSSLKWFIIALLLMPFAIHLVALPLESILNDRSIPWISTSFAKVISTALIGLLIVTVLAFFEEIGWRAWLMPRLTQIMSVRTSMIVGALLWSLWHVPFVLAGIMPIEGLSVYETLLVPIGTFGAGLVINWIWLNTRNILAVSIAHGSLNHLGQLAFRYINDDEHALQLIIGVDCALIVTGIIAVTVLTPKQPLHNVPFPQPQSR